MLQIHCSGIHRWSRRDAPASINPHMVLISMASTDQEALYPSQGKWSSKNLPYDEDDEDPLRASAPPPPSVSSWPPRIPGFSVCSERKQKISVSIASIFFHTRFPLAAPLSLTQLEYSFSFFTMIFFVLSRATP